MTQIDIKNIISIRVSVHSCEGGICVFYRDFSFEYDEGKKPSMCMIPRIISKSNVSSDPRTHTMSMCSTLQLTRTKFVGYMSWVLSSESLVHVWQPPVSLMLGRNSSRYVVSLTDVAYLQPF